MHNGILFNHKRGRYPPICNNVGGPWLHYGEISERNTVSAVWYGLYVEPKEVKLVRNRVKWWLPGDGGEDNSDSDLGVQTFNE